MKQDKFMLDYYPANTKVTVDANELQALIRQNRTLEQISDMMSGQIEALRNVNSKLKDTIIELQASQPPHIKLDIKG